MKSETGSFLHKRSPWKRPIYVVGVPIVVLLLAWGAAESGYQLRAQSLTKALNDITQQSLKSSGAVEVDSPHPGSNCGHYLDTILNGAAFNSPAAPCPLVSSEWLVPVKQGQEEFIASVLSSSGFHGGTIGQRVGGGTNGSVGVSLELAPLGDQKAPYAAPAGTQWMRVWLTAE